MKILKGRKEKTSEDEKQKIIEELLKTGKIKTGQLIDYAYFKELYEPYKEKKEQVEFAEILGINYASFIKIKNEIQKAKIIDYRDKKKVDRIKYILMQDSRYYSEEELENLAKKYNCDMNTIIMYIFCAGKNNEYTQAYTDILRQKRKIRIGNTKCSKGFSEKYAKVILDQSDKISKINSKKYCCRHLQPDIASEAIVYLLQKGGEIEKNFEDNDEMAKELIILKIRTYIKYRCMQQLKKPKEISYQVRYTSYKGEGKEANILDRVADNSQKLEEEVENRILIQEDDLQLKSIGQKYAELLMRNIEQGLTIEEALGKMESQLKKSQEEILKILRNYMIKTKKVRKNKDGGFILGE